MVQRAAVSAPVGRGHVLQMNAGSAPFQRAVMQFQRTDVCLKKASGTYMQGTTPGTFSFREGSKGSDVLITTKSHPSTLQDMESMAEKYLKKYGEIPRDATGVTFTECDTYGIKNR